MIFPIQQTSISAPSVFWAGKWWYQSGGWRWHSPYQTGKTVPVQAKTLQTQWGQTHGAGCAWPWFRFTEPLGKRPYKNWITTTFSGVLLFKHISVYIVFCSYTTENSQYLGTLHISYLAEVSYYACMQASMNMHTYRAASISTILYDWNTVEKDRKLPGIPSQFLFQISLTFPISQSQTNNLTGLIHSCFATNQLFIYLLIKFCHLRDTPVNSKFCPLILLHSERPNLHTILAFLSAIGLNEEQNPWPFSYLGKLSIFRYFSLTLATSGPATSIPT